MNINLDATVDFLVGLLNIPSPTGYYVEAIDYVRKAFDAIPELTFDDHKGALVATWRAQHARHAASPPIPIRWV